MLNPDIQILVEAESSEEKSRISELNVTAVYLDEDLIHDAIVENLSKSSPGHAEH